MPSHYFLNHEMSFPFLFHNQFFKSTLPLAGLDSYLFSKIKLIKIINCL